MVIVMMRVVGLQVNGRLMDCFSVVTSNPQQPLRLDPARPNFADTLKKTISGLRNSMVCCVEGLLGLGGNYTTLQCCEKNRKEAVLRSFTLRLYSDTWCTPRHSVLLYTRLCAIYHA